MEATGVGAGRAHGRRVRIALALALAVGVAGAPEASGAPARVPGIDVSKWQGEVDWAAVASTSVRFVIMRATIGHDEVDPRYEEYLAGATAAGLVVGAYHRAHVAAVPGDAKAEADHFVDTAQIAAGDILPVLDIEEYRGLSVSQLRAWVRAWVGRVFERTGVRPMIYTGTYFWRTYLGDTTWFADNGYPLWIADWSSPFTVPADDWGGHGWTFWQWTSTGTVAGIDGPVDRDRFLRSTLARGRIASLSVTPALGGTIEGPRIRCGDGATKCTRLANPDAIVTLTATPDHGASLAGWTGACASAGEAPACDVRALGAKTVSAVFAYPVAIRLVGSGGGTVSSSSGALDCGTACVALLPAGSAVSLTAEPDSASVFEGWDGACDGGDPTCTFDVTAPAEAIAAFDSVVALEQDGPGTAFGWGRAAETRAIGGSYRWERRAGASASFAFSGGAVTLFSVSGPRMGRARVEIDGEVVGTVDGYAPSLSTRVERRFDGLDPGPHTLAVIALGTKRPASTGTRVALDALRWGGRLRADPPGTWTWREVADPSASGGSYAIGDAPGGFARVRFEGTGLTLRALRGPAMGRAEIWVDGERWRVVDLYAVAEGYGSVSVVTGLADGTHSVRVVVTGRHRPASAGSSVAIDRWVVR